MPDWIFYAGLIVCGVIAVVLLFRAMWRAMDRSRSFRIFILLMRGTWGMTDQEIADFIGHDYPPRRPK